MLIKVGPFEFEIWEGGYPVWTRIRYEGKEIGGIRHDELRHLQYGVGEAMRLAESQLPDAYRGEV